VGYASLNGGTEGGAGGSTTTVSSLAAFTAAAANTKANVIYVKGTISGSTMVKLTSDTSLLGSFESSIDGFKTDDFVPGVDSSSKLVGIGLSIKKVNNVIVRNLAISKVKADTGDAIAIQVAKNVWIDHMYASIT
jgi:pectate lyase